MTKKKEHQESKASRQTRLKLLYDTADQIDRGKITRSKIVERMQNDPVFADMVRDAGKLYTSRGKVDRNNLLDIPRLLKEVIEVAHSDMMLIPTTDTQLRDKEESVDFFMSDTIIHYATHAGGITESELKGYRDDAREADNYCRLARQKLEPLWSELKLVQNTRNMMPDGKYINNEIRRQIKIILRSCADEYRAKMKIPKKHPLSNKQVVLRRIERIIQCGI
jgi:hypothetical protein